MTTWASRILLVLLVLAMTAIASPARGDPTAAERETARTLLLGGREKRKAGKLQEALADFGRAHAIMGVPTTGLDLGKTQEALGLLVEARATLLEVVRAPAADGEPKAFKRARQEAKELADAIAPRLATLTVAVTPTPIRVELDGAELAAASVGTPLKVNPGKHKVVALLGGDEKEGEVELGEGDAKSLTLTFEPKPVAPAPAPAPVAARPAPHVAKSPPPTAAKRIHPLVWVGAAAAVVGAGVGIPTGILAFKTKTDLTAHCSSDGVHYLCPSSTFADIDRGERWATISTVTFVVAAIGAAIMAYGLLAPQEAPPMSLRGARWSF